MKIVKNIECNGIELYFDNKPTQDIINMLKDAKFRWHNLKKCWYAKDNERNNQIAESIKENKIIKVENEEICNDLGIKVGDIFYMSWGYEQTNLDFFQVVALKGKTQVIIKEVYVSKKEEFGISSMSRDVILDNTHVEILENSKCCFVKDNSKGMIKKVCGTKESPYLNMTSYANAHLYKGQKLYESWYY